MILLVYWWSVQKRTLLLRATVYKYYLFGDGCLRQYQDPPTIYAKNKPDFRARVSPRSEPYILLPSALPIHHPHPTLRAPRQRPSALRSSLAMFIRSSSCITKRTVQGFFSSDKHRVATTNSLPYSNRCKETFSVPKNTNGDVVDAVVASQHVRLLDLLGDGNITSGSFRRASRRALQDRMTKEISMLVSYSKYCAKIR